jgi:DNA-binding NarL/FixJ family response regulator
MTERFRVVLLDDHHAVREGIKRLLEKDGEYAVVGEFSRGRALLDTAESLHPDLFLLDISLPDMSGLEVLTDLRKLCPDSKFAALTMHCRDDYIVELVRAGIRGYITKDTDPQIFLCGIGMIMQGEYFFDRFVMEELISRAIRIPAKIHDLDDECFAKLNDQEKDIFHLIVQGFTPQEIGEKKYISHRTVENYRTKIIRKLNLKNSAELIRYAQKMGLLD